MTASHTEAGRGSKGCPPEGHSLEITGKELRS